MINLYPFIRPLIFALPPEKAHSFALAVLKAGLPSFSAYSMSAEEAGLLKTKLLGLEFPNPLGMAAGFDKNADLADGILPLGFGFTEIGTVTPRPQDGNPRPRLFRLKQDYALVNRMGFNNAGHEAVYRKLVSRKAKRRRPGLLGVNIGANKDSEDKIADYVLGLQKFYDVADYFTVNISSPNTPGLRDLQGRENLRRLLTALHKAREDMQERHGVLRPVFLKIAPDLTEAALDDIAAEFSNMPLSGLIISNTTISRPQGLHSHQQTGGLSGRPLFALSTIILAKMRQRLGSHIPLIGVGGVENAETALAKIEAGADLVQLYSGLVYQGVGAVPKIVKGLAAACRQAGVDHIGALRDRKSAQWAARSPEF